MATATPAVAASTNWVAVLEQFLQANPTLFPTPAPAAGAQKIDLSMFIPLLPPQYQGIATLMLPFAESILASSMTQSGTGGTSTPLSSIPLIGGLIAMFSGIFGGAATPAATTPAT